MVINVGEQSKPSLQDAEGTDKLRDGYYSEARRQRRQAIIDGMRGRR